MLPISLRDANAFVLAHHRHSGQVRGCKFCVAVVDDLDAVHGVAIVGRPVARRLDDGKTAEVTRLCTDGIANGCSFLYSRCARIAKLMGYQKIITYSHGFYIAVIQGFFRDYYYTRGSAFSFLVEQKPEYARYFTSWEQITPVSFPNPMQNRIIENYCSGVYLSPDQVIQLLKDMEQDPKVLEDLEGLWSNGQIAVLKKALSAAAKSGVGLLEATEVVEPNPISPNESTSYSNLYHCDRDGVYLYIDAVSGQLADAIGKNEG